MKHDLVGKTRLVGSEHHHNIENDVCVVYEARLGREDQAGWK